MTSLMQRFFRKIWGRDLQDGKSGRGRWGEEQAARYLIREKGMQLLVKNWRCGHDEIDIILIDKGVLVFVEVRTRAEDALVSGYYSVDQKKKKILTRVCRAYLRKLKDPPAHFRFDIVEVRLDDLGQATLHHYSNISLFSKHFKI